MNANSDIITAFAFSFFNIGTNIMGMIHNIKSGLLAIDNPISKLDK